MKAILFADRHGNELYPLTKRTAVALLPIATKPTIAYALDALLMTQIREVTVVISAYGGKIEQLLGDGTPWDMQFTYALTRGQENPMTVLHRLGLKDTEYLLIRGDILQDVAIASFLTAAQEFIDKSVYLTINGQFTGTCLLRLHDQQDAAILEWNISAWQNFSQQYPEVKTIELAGKFSLLTSLNDFHQTHIDILENSYPHIVLPGWSVHSQLLVGRRSMVAIENQGIIGAYCRVHEKATLQKSIACDEVIIDSDAKIQHSVILPGTYVGKAVELNQAIVWGNTLIRLDNNTIVENVDSFLLADLTRSTFRTFLTSQFHRLLGIIIGILSLPLWPLALLAALLQHPSKLLHKIRVRSNLHEIGDTGEVHPHYFFVWEWSTSIPLLRHLPKLLPVMSGKIRLIGVSLETTEQTQARTEPYEKIRDDAPVGLLGPSQIGLAVDATQEERLLVEAYYARTRHLGKDILWLMRGLFCLFSKRAWWSTSN